MKRDVYCLTKRGAQELANQIDIKSVRYPQDGIQYNRDFEHREGTVDFRIALDLWAQKHSSAVDFVHTYFNGTGSQRGKTKFKSETEFVLINGERFVPDLTFRMTMADSESRLFAFEYHRGKDSGKIANQLLTHTIALAEGTLSDFYRHPYANFALSVYEHQSTMDCTIDRLHNEAGFPPFAPCFLFNTLENVKTSFSDDWLNFEGTKSPFFRE